MSKTWVLRRSQARKTAGGGTDRRASVSRGGWCEQRSDTEKQHWRCGQFQSLDFILIFKKLWGLYREELVDIIITIGCDPGSWWRAERLGRQLARILFSRLSCSQEQTQIIDLGANNLSGRWSQETRNNVQVNETAEKAITGNSPPARPARLYPTLDVTFVAWERQRRLVTWGETLLVWIRCFQGS